MRHAFLAVVVVSSIGLNASVQKQVWISFLDAKGIEIMAFAAQSEAYTPGKVPRVGGRFDRIVRDPHGHVISERGYYGWLDGKMVIVVVLAYVPVDGAENRVHPQSSPQLRVEELARYTLPVGATRHLVEPKAMGFGEVTLRTELRDVR